MNRREYLESMHAITTANRTRTCQWCGIEFIMRPPSGKANRGEIKAGLFCSRQCRWDSMKQEHENDRCKIYIIKCAVCGKPLTRRNKAGVVCGSECAQEHERRRSFKRNSVKKKTKKVCKECGKTFVSEYGDKKRSFCSPHCVRRAGRNGSHNNRQRARKHGVEYEYINSTKVFERDGWRCQICGKSTPKIRRGSSQSNAPEMDHRIPISKGGGHLYSNVQCACRACNGKKSNYNEIGQLPMFNISVKANRGGLHSLQPIF